MSTTSRWSDVVALFESALEYTGQSRDAFLDRVCGGDEDLRNRVMTLLKADAEASTYLTRDSGALQLARQIQIKPRIPARIGPYRVVRLIGQGGMGLVCLAERDQDFRRTVAIKTLSRILPSAAAISRFRREREILSQLEHVNIARLYDGGLDDEVGLYLVMEYIEGLAIDEYCAKRKLSVKGKLALFLAVCDAVAYAHRNLVVHRDLKPSNVLVNADGVVKLLDFGIAKWLQPSDSALTRTGEQVMTLPYASPEHLRGGSITTSADIYSLGVMLYELLTGSRPHDLPRSPFDAANKIMTTTPRYPSQAAATDPEFAGSSRLLRGDIDRIVLKALSTNPERRYSSAEALANDIHLHLVGRPIRAKERRIGYTVRKFIVRNRFQIASSTIVSLLILSTVVMMVISEGRYRSEQVAADGLASYLVDLFEIADPALRSDTSITAREILDVGEKQARQRLPNDSEHFGMVMGFIGGLYTKIGDFEAAERLHSSALATIDARRQDLIARNRFGLAVSQFEQGHFDEAEKNFTVALGMTQPRGVEENHLVSEILVTMSQMAREQDQLGRADSLLENAKQIRLSYLSPTHPKIAEILALQGVILRQRNDLTGAKALFYKVLDIYRTSEPTPSLEIAAVENSLGVLYSEMDQWELSLEAFQRAQAIISTRLGETHPRYGINLLNMAIPIERLFGSDSASVLTRAAISNLEASRGIDHPDVSVALGHLAVQMRKRGDFVEAESLYVMALKSAKQSLSPTHEFTSRTHHNYAILLRNLDRKREAMNAYQAAIQGYIAVEPRLDTRRASALNGLGKVQRDLGMLQEAVESFRACLEIRQRVLEPGHWRLGTAHSLLGESLALVGRHGEAELHLNKGLEILLRANGPGDPKTREAQERLELFRKSLPQAGSEEPDLVASSG